MRMRYLQEFRTLAKTGNFTLAAKQLGITQTALSRHLQYLEQELGTELMTRSTRRMQLTRAGKRFLRYAEETLAVHDEMSDALAELDASAGQTENLRLAVAYNAGVYHLDNLYLDFVRKNPNVICTMVQAEGENLVKMLVTGECDAGFLLGVTSELMQHEELSYYEVGILDTMVAVMSESHPLAGRQELTVSMLSGERFVKLPMDSATALSAKMLCDQAGFKQKTAIQVLREPDCLIYLQDHPHIALLFRTPTEFAIGRRALKGLVLRELTPPVEAQMYLVCRKENRAYAVQSLIHAVDENLSRR